jgi:hypothetical protein
MSAMTALTALCDYLAAAAKAGASEPDAVSVQLIAGTSVAIFRVHCDAEDVDRIVGEHCAHHVGAEAHQLGLRAFVDVAPSPIRRIRVGASA